MKATAVLVLGCGNALQAELPRRPQLLANLPMPHLYVLAALTKYSRV